MRMVLVLDDDADLRETVSDMLAEDGYRVCTARDAASALAQLGSLPVGLVVMDYAIPVPAEGEAFLRAKAADPRFAKIPVILMSGYELDGGMPGTGGCPRRAPRRRSRATSRSAPNDPPRSRASPCPSPATPEAPTRRWRPRAR